MIKLAKIFFAIAMLPVLTSCSAPAGSTSAEQGMEPKADAEQNMEPKADAEQNASQEKAEVPVETNSIDDVYSEIISEALNHNSDYLPIAVADSLSSGEGVYEYARFDINNDGIEELLLSDKVQVSQTFYGRNLRIFTCELISKDNYAPKEVEFTEQILPLNVLGAADNNGIYLQTDISRGTGETNFRLATMADNSISLSDAPVSMTLFTPEFEAFTQENPALQWTNIDGSRESSQG